MTANTPLHVAALQGQQDLVKELLLSDHYQVNYKNASNETALHLACYSGHLAVTRLLLNEFGADINARNNVNDTPLNNAALGGHTDVVQALISEFGCSANTIGFEDRTLLHQACSQGHLELARKVILEYNIPVDSRSSKKETPLHLSCSFGHLAVTRLLLTEFGADVNARNYQNNIPLNSAVNGDHIDVVEALISEFGCSANTKGFQGRTLLHQACEKGHLELARKLILEYNIPVDSRSSEKNTPLHLSCNFGHLAVTRLLLTEFGADVNARNYPNNTPLNSAVYGGHIDVVEALISEFGCCANTKGFQGRTLLHQACEKGRLELARKLILEYNIPVDSRSSEKNTPLNCTALGGHTDVVQALISEFGCSANTRGFEDRTLLHQACSRGHLELARKLILEYNIPVDSRSSRKETPLHLSCNFGHLAVTRLLLTGFGADVNARNYINDTPLNRAALGGHIDVVEALISDFGCSANTRGYEGRTLLHQACSEDHVQLVETLLLKHSWLVLSVDDYGNTPLHFASIFSHPAVVNKLLFDYNVPVFFRNKNGKTAKEVARTEAITYSFNMYLKQRASQVQTEYQKLQTLSKRKFSSGSLTRIFIVGYPQAGKSSLVEALKNSRKFFLFKKRLVDGDVSPHTAGIIPTIYQGKNDQNLMFFDFAGDAEYYSSHAAILEVLAVGDCNIFFIVVDLREETETLVHKLGYWLSFISYHSKNPAAKANIVIIGSHADILQSRGQSPENIVKCLGTIAHNFCEGTPCMELQGAVELDCCSFQAQNLRKLQEKVNDISQNAPTLQLSEVACILLGLLDRDFKEVTTCTIATLLEHIKSTGIHLPIVGSELFVVTQELHKVGLLMIIRSAKIEDSLLLLNISNLTKEVHERLFSKEALASLSSGVHAQYKKYLRLGILPESALQEIIPKYVNKECLLQLQYCHEINTMNVLQSHPIQQTHLRSDSEQLLFFPALLQLQREDIAWANEPSFTCSKGWYLKCTGKFDYFPPRFLHILLLRLAFQFAPSTYSRSPSITDQSGSTQSLQAIQASCSELSLSDTSSKTVVPREVQPTQIAPTPATQTNQQSIHISVDDTHMYSRRCHMWKSGIHWLMEEGVECFVEVVKGNKGVVVVARSEEDCDVECASVFVAVVQKVLETKTEFCHSITPETYLLHPEEINQSSLPDVDKLHLFAMSEVERVLLENKNRAVSVDGSRFLVPEILVYMKDCIFWSK